MKLACVLLRSFLVRTLHMCKTFTKGSPAILWSWLLFLRFHLGLWGSASISRWVRTVQFYNIYILAIFYMLFNIYIFLQYLFSFHTVIQFFTTSPVCYFSFQPVPHDWGNKGGGMCHSVCGMMHIKEALLLIEKSSLCDGSGFRLSLSE